MQRIIKRTKKFSLSRLRRVQVSHLRSANCLPVRKLFQLKQPILLIFFLLFLFGCRENDNVIRLFHASYDPTREMFKDINLRYSKQFAETTGKELRIQMSHSGSGKQSRSVIDGLNADVVSLALAYDIDIIAEKAEKLPNDWQQKLPFSSTPYYSTIVFLVRKGNPKNIQNWQDLAKPGVEVVSPNPKTSGGARWNYLAAWGAIREQGGSGMEAREFVKRLYGNVRVLDTGARGAANTFVQRNIGDVLISWENEAFLAVEKMKESELQIVVPEFSILAEPPVAVISQNAYNNGRLQVAQNYLTYLYEREAQDVIARHHFRVRDKIILKKYAEKYGKLKMFDLKKYFTNWSTAQKTHFSDGGIFDQIFTQQ